ncbi:AI-2E family transporter [Geminocystis sp. GBBB08]|uniref:AI-2E family transporter n=1 Tax=Geminocystis sp. GBBB08 TaxID=2604140 RepID=UPI0027E2CC50|nr:AI-2E family transporter [Geminocystis sp. GBBB08]MBL1210576.1 AI-2E family transporter [Geminocystis sp. GBBB08]
MKNNSKLINPIIQFFTIGFLLAWCFILIRPFIIIILWAVIMAIALFPVFEWLKNRLGGRAKLSAIILALVGIVIILGPVSIIATVLFHNAQNIVEGIDAGTLVIPPPPSEIADIPIIGKSLSELWRLASVNLKGLISQFHTQIVEFSKTLLLQATNISLILLKFIISIVIAVILTLKAKSLNQGVILFVSRLAPSRGEEFIQLATITIRSVTRGVIGVAVIQTLLVACGLILGKIPAAGILTLVCLFLSIIQIGPGLIVLGVIVFAWSTMNPFGALLFTIWMIGATLIDNILKPILMGQGLPVPIVIILLGVIGGTLAHGILGLFVGPVILILGYELILAWMKEDSET